MKMPTLYSRTSTGAVQTWEIEVSENRYRTVSGQIDGKKITSEWTACQAKNIGRSNATSPEEQAQAEAAAKWKKKVESGYHETPDQIDKVVFVEPMLAKNWEDYCDDTRFPVFSQPKYDGIRCVVTSAGMYTRNGKTIVSAPHIAEELSEFFQNNPDVILDGELYCDKLANDFNSICSLVKKTKPSKQDLVDSRAIQYWIYDLVDESRNFSARNLWLSQNIPASDHLRLVPTATVSSLDQLNNLYEEYISSGYEGQMVRLDRPYERKRSRGLLKRKEFIDEEFSIMDVLEGDGNKSGMAGSMVLSKKTGEQFNSNIKGDRDHLRELLKNRNELIGKNATVKYFNLTPDGIPRFPYVIAIRDYE